MSKRLTEDKTGPRRTAEKTSTGGGGRTPIKKTLGGTPPPKKDTSGRVGEDDPMRDWPNLRKRPMMSKWAALLSPDVDQGKDLDSQGNPHPLQDHLGGSHRGTVTPPVTLPKGEGKGDKVREGLELLPTVSLNY